MFTPQQFTAQQFVPQQFAPRAVTPAFDVGAMMAQLMPIIMMVLMFSLIKPMMKGIGG